METWGNPGPSAHLSDDEKRFPGLPVYPYNTQFS
jgi:hypothetical protein